MKAAILTIGDEILNGQTVDTNSAWLARELNLIGVDLILKFSVPDQEVAILEGLRYASEHAQLVLTTGGLGPTKDDITKKSLANFLEDVMIFDKKTYDNILQILRQRGRTMTELHRQQCMMPSTALLLSNSQGTAPGMWVEKNQNIYISLPGVPREMEAIMRDNGLRMISDRVLTSYIVHSVIQTAGIGETLIAEQIERITATMPAQLSIAFLPGTASVKLRLTAKGENYEELNGWLTKYTQEISYKIREHVFGFGDITLAAALGQICKQHDLQLATAESCTGGHIAELITSESGASDYFRGSIVAYSNELKTNLLRVPDAVLETNGAVSEIVVRQMVRGAIAATGANVAIATSGIAGPTGGTADKPVGTIWVAVGTATEQEVTCLQLNKNRQGNINYTAIYGLNMMRKFIENVLVPSKVSSILVSG